jgi:very-short-patch-repair endonuclease
MSSEQFHYHATPELWRKLKPLARQMRHEPTPAEHQLWQNLRGRRLNGAKFRRQYSIERFIVDFICLEHRLIIEVDGSIHDEQQEYDQIRQEFLERAGFKVLRFTNGDVFQRLNGVLEVIGEAIL